MLSERQRIGGIESQARLVRLSTATKMSQVDKGHITMHRQCRHADRLGKQRSWLNSMTLQFCLVHT